MNKTLEIPIFPLNTVLYPQGRLPLRIFEPRYLAMTKECIGDDSVFGVCMISEGRDTGAPAVPVEFGCTARIKHWEVPAPGLFTLLTQGEDVFRIRERYTTPSGLTRALVQLEPPLLPSILPAARWQMRDLLQDLIERADAASFADPIQLDDTAWVARRLAEVLPLPPATKQQLLQMESPIAMLDLVERIIQQLQNR